MSPRPNRVATPAVLLNVLLTVLFLAAMAPPGLAFDNVDAHTTWTMAVEGDATLVDTRTLEEVMWVGAPAAADGTPLATTIPWVNITIAADGEVSAAANPRFDELFTRTFPDKDRPIVLMCRSGGRSAKAAAHLEDLGYTRLYNLDAPAAASDEDLGVGGFQGRADATGHRGYPGRVDQGKPVSWLDSGLPVTHKLDPARIPN